MNIEPDQLMAACAFAQQQGLLGTRLELLEGKYDDDTTFPNNSFDAFYAAQPFTCSQGLYTSFGVARVMKPGAWLTI